MLEQQEPQKLEYFASAEPVRSSAIRKTLGLAGFIGFGLVGLFFCVQFVALIISGGGVWYWNLPLVIFVAAFLIWLAAREFRDFLR